MDTEGVLRLLQDVAAEVITPRFRSLRAGEVTEKRPGDLVTVADREAEVLITRALVAAYPDAVVLGEEAFSVDPSVRDRWQVADHAFTVDPVDGTQNFVRGSADHAVMASEQVAGETVRAWIWQPQHERSFVAERGAGAWSDGTRLSRPAVATDPQEWRGATSRRAWLGRSLPGMAELELSWVCCGVDYPRLVEGAADFVLYGAASYGAGAPWDHAPGALILSEAGGVLGTEAGTAYTPRGASQVLIAAADARVLDVVRREVLGADWLASG